MIHKETLITCLLSKRISGCFGEELALAISACLFFFLKLSAKFTCFARKITNLERIRNVFLKRIHFRVEKKRSPCFLFSILALREGNFKGILRVNKRRKKKIILSKPKQMVLFRCRGS